MIALTRAVSPRLADCELTHRGREPIDVVRAEQQHTAYERLLAELGCTVRRLPPSPEHPDGVFVEDTGVGIAESDQKRIFERFYRVGKSRGSGDGGTGIGLSIVKNLTVTLGGEVRVSSRPGEGARFEVLLPKSDSPPKGAGMVNHPEGSGERKGV